MRDSLADAYRDAVRRVRRLQQRETTDFRRWLETTTNLNHLTALIVVPLIIVGITLLSDRISELSFLLWPPLASATYTLFTDPDGRYSTTRNFVGGLSVGAACGWFSVIFAETILHVPEIRALEVHPVSAGIAVFLTIAVTWALDLEMPAAFSTALLAVVVGVHDETYVLSVVISTGIVAAVFYLWRAGFYDRRSTYLYQSTKRDDHVLVPCYGTDENSTAMFGGRIAAAHDAGKVVLLGTVDDEAVAEAAEAMVEESYVPETVRIDMETDDLSETEHEAARRATARVEGLAGRIETHIGVPCDVVVTAEPTRRAATVLGVARETNTDLIVTPYEEEHGGLSGFVRDLFRSRVDVIAFRPANGRTRWKRVLVPVRRAGDLAHTMLDFAQRLVGRNGFVSVCTCIDGEDERRRRETMLANLVGTASTRCETRVSRSSIENFLAANQYQYDVVLMGASTDRSGASRFVSPPTFERIHQLDCDVAIVHRA